MRKLLGTAAALATLLVAACAGPSADLSSATRIDRSANPAQLGPTLQQQLDALPLPPGADAVAFNQLKQTFAAQLRSGVIKQISAPPTTPSAAVSDFDVNATQDTVTFSWSYRNPGDYNRDGEVNISDLAVLGRWLGRTSASPDWDEARVADGTGDGEVNVSDLSPMGGNYGAVVEGYRLRLTEVPSDEGSWQVLATIPRGDSQLDPATGALRFMYTILIADLAEPDVYFQVVPYEGTALGIGSNSDTISALPPSIGGVSPLAGDSGALVTFNVDVFGEPPLTYEWDFGGGAQPNVSNGASPQVTLGAPGSYSGLVSVNNAQGGDSFQFALTVSSNQPPTVNLAAVPNAGNAPLTAGLTATASDPDGLIVEYDWDIDGDGTYEATTGTVPTNTVTFTTPGLHTVGVRVTDNGGLTASDTTDVTVAAQPSAVLQANQTSVIAPEYVSLDASGSSSPNGAITNYQWDWNGDGNIDADTKTDPHHRAYIDAPVGIYDAKVIVTDALGLQGSATVKITVTGTKFIAPPIETYVNKAGPNDTPTVRWLKNSYSTLPEWRDGNGVYQSAYFAQWCNEVFTRLNSYRVGTGKPALTRLPVLDLLMQAHERDQALRGYFGHTNPEGLDYSGRVLAINPPKSLDDWGEIIAQGQESPQEVVQGWLASPPHKAIIDTAHLQYVGVAVYYKSNGARGLESYFGVFFTAYKGGSAPPPDHDWLEPDEVR